MQVKDLMEFLRALPKDMEVVVKSDSYLDDDCLEPAIARICQATEVPLPDVEDVAFLKEVGDTFLGFSEAYLLIE